MRDRFIIEIILYGIMTVMPWLLIVTIMIPCTPASFIKGNLIAHKSMYKRHNGNYCYPSDVSLQSARSMWTGQKAKLNCLWWGYCKLKWSCTHIFTPLSGKSSPCRQNLYPDIRKGIKRGLGQEIHNISPKDEIHHEANLRTQPRYQLLKTV